ncbi:hypothetical protein CMV_022301 [Castanea mollissima]|uniref:Uncharacterized protein n=1 Tax=Castanea mollissima TaxID=60419 RepID=A0A8J4QMH3_9ROSI|nr:hypothetical protein CMV_022301 [Castanea mollissima]
MSSPCTSRPSISGPSISGPPISFFCCISSTSRLHILVKCFISGRDKHQNKGNETRSLPDRCHGNEGTGHVLYLTDTKPEGDITVKRHESFQTHNYHHLLNCLSNSEVQIITNDIKWLPLQKFGSIFKLRYDQRELQKKELLPLP